jgi:hypothetical protein
LIWLEFFGFFFGGAADRKFRPLTFRFIVRLSGSFGVVVDGFGASVDAVRTS